MYGSCMITIVETGLSCINFQST